MAWHLVKHTQHTDTTLHPVNFPEIVWPPNESAGHTINLHSLDSPSATDPAPHMQPGAMQATGSRYV